MVKKQSSLSTKFVSVFIVGFILLIIRFLVFQENYQNFSMFAKLGTNLELILGNSMYALFVAKLWEIFERDGKTFSIGGFNQIALACVVGTIIETFFYGISDFFDTKTLLYTYIFIGAEIFMIYYAEKILINLSKNEKLINNILNFSYSIITIYIYAIVVECFLSWIPGLDWNFLPIKIFWHLVGPYMVLFQLFIPPIAGIDFSPVLAIFFIMFIRKYITIYLADLLIECNKNSEEETSDENS